MPQLDHFSFFSQVFWVLAIFTSFYFLNLRYSLPAIASILKVRRRVLQKSQQVIDGLQQDKFAGILEPHVELLSILKVFAPQSPSINYSSESSTSSDVKKCFDIELQKINPTNLAFRASSVFSRKKSF